MRSIWLLLHQAAEPFPLSTMRQPEAKGRRADSNLAVMPLAVSRFAVAGRPGSRPVASLVMVTISIDLAHAASLACARRGKAAGHSVEMHCVPNHRDQLGDT